MNNEHYRLEALKLACDKATELPIIATDLAEQYYQWIMQDKVKAEEEAKKAELPQYKIPPNQVK